MNNGAARGRNGGTQPVLTHLIGVGLEREFTAARQLTNAPVMWLCSVESLPVFYDHPPPPDPSILLVDGDLPSEELIALLDQFVALGSTKPIILQITNPQIRLVVSIMQRGVLDVLAKPYTLARLNSALEEILTQPARRPPRSSCSGRELAAAAWHLT